MAHNVLAYGRWFVQNTQVNTHVEAVDASQGRLVDPASIDYSRLDLKGRWYPEINEAVGASAVIAGVWAITGSERYLQVEIVQGIVDGLAALLVYWIALQLFNRTRPAMFAAILYAVYPPLAWQTSSAYNDVWAVDFTVAIVAAYLMVLQSGYRWRWLIVCGLLAGIGAYFRPQVLLIAPVLALVTAAATGWRETLRRTFTTALVASLLLVPWTIRNYNDFHAFVPVRSAFWETMWGGLAEVPNSFGGDFAEGSIAVAVHRARPDLVAQTPAWDAYLKHYVIRVLSQHPLFYLEVLAHRVALATFLAHENLWMHRGAGIVLDYKGGLLAFIVNQPFEVLEYALQPLVFVLAMLGLGFTWRRWKKENLILVALVLVVLLPYIAIHVEGRYLLPAYFAYFIWIGLGGDLLFEEIAARLRRAPAAPMSLPGAAGALDL